MEEMQEIRRLHKYLDQGKFDLEYINAKIALLSQSDKRQKTLVQIIQMQGKFKNGNGILKKLYGTNLITEHEAISVSPIDLENEIVICPFTSKEMTRSYCLDYSGEREHHDGECRNCEVGLATKRLLTPPVQETI